MDSVTSQASACVTIRSLNVQIFLYFNGHYVRHAGDNISDFFKSNDAEHILIEFRSGNELDLIPVQF